MACEWLIERKEQLSLTFSFLLWGQPPFLKKSKEIFQSKTLITRKLCNIKYVVHPFRTDTMIYIYQYSYKKNMLPLSISIQISSKGLYVCSIFR